MTDPADIPSEAVFRRIREAIDRGIVVLEHAPKAPQQIATRSTAEHDGACILRQITELVPGTRDAHVIRMYPVPATGDGLGELASLVEAGRVGVVIIEHLPMLSRATTQCPTMTDLLSRAEALVATHSGLFDLRLPGDALMLSLLPILGEFENRSRAIRLLTARYVSARDLRYPVSLPTGLVWAPPSDPEYAKRASEAGLKAWLTRTETCHRACSRIGDRDHYVLPFPDADVFQASALKVEWLLQYRDLKAVLANVQTHPSWPRAGHIPVLRGGRFSPAMRPHWIKVTPAALRSWLRCPATWGCYAYRSSATSALGADIWCPNAFPSFGLPDHQELAMNILG